MKKIFTLLMAFAFGLSINAQLKVLEPADLVTDINGHTVEVVDLPSASDMEIEAFIVNTGSTSLSLVCKRIEVDGLLGTENATCWSVCPPYILTGDRPTYTANIGGTNLTESVSPNDTIKTFVGHYKPSSMDGCSLFKYEWADATSGTVYASIYVRFIHQSSGTCTAGIEDFSKMKLSLYPNPATNNVTLALNEMNGEFSYEVVNLLGQQEINGVVSSDRTQINTSKLTEGVYFVTLKNNGKLVRTEKLVVRH